MNIKILENAKTVAEKLALKSEYKFKHGAVLIKKRQILSLGFNRFSLFVPKKYDKTDNQSERKMIHAEYDCLAQIDEEDLIYGSTMVLFGCRVNKNNEIKHINSKPCKVCQSFLRKFGVKEIFYNKHGEWINWQLERQ